MADPLRILVVDDDVVDRSAASRVASELPFEVRVLSAGSSGEALQVAIAEKPHVVLLDVHLGPESGEAVVDMLRAAGVSIPIVLLTGTSDPERVADGMRAGAIDYIPKQALDVERLERAVRSAVRVADAERAAGEGRAREERQQVQLTKLVEASIAIGAQTTLDAVCQETVASIEGILGAAGVVTIELNGRSLAACRHLACDAETEDMDRFEAPPFRGPSGIEIRIRGVRPGRPFDENERLIGAQIAQVATNAAEKLVLVERAQDRARERQEIVAVVSHDLRTPLQSFSLGVDTLESAVGDGPAKATVMRLRRSVKSMKRLLTDLLDVSRIQDSVLSIRVAKYDPQRLLDDVAEQAAPLAEAKSIGFVVEVLTSDPILCDGPRVTQAVSNLVSNAIRHTERGHVAIRVKSVGAKTVRFEIEDTGTGIRPEIRAQLFERLFQDRSSGPGGGLGLGLYIVRGIATAHGGTVGVESTLGSGSTFFMELPREPPKRGE